MPKPDDWQDFRRIGHKAILFGDRKSRLAGGCRVPVAFAILLALAIPAIGKNPVIATTSSARSVASTTRPAQAKPPRKFRSRARRPAPSRRKVVSYGDSTEGDDASRDDAIVRAAAVETLDKLMGSMVVVDPSTGRILTIVNQKLALESYQPCSTFKPAVALAALEEGLIENDKTRLRLGRRWYLDLVQSLAFSNNLYFAKLGQLLGLAKLREYGQRFGFGELAGWGLPQEPRGALPDTPPPRYRGGVGKIASFGEGISQTPLQLASFMSAVANGGTLFYLQYPQDPDHFEPMVKRRLEIATWLAPVRQGLEEAVLSGTARRARQPDITILGKTGTCSENGARLGWFAGYSQQEGGLAVVVLLRRAPRVDGPHAAEVAGRFFRKLADQNYLARSPHTDLSSAPPAVIQFSPLR